MSPTAVSGRPMDTEFTRSGVVADLCVRGCWNGAVSELNPGVSPMRGDAYIGASRKQKSQRITFARCAPSKRGTTSLVPTQEKVSLLDVVHIRSLRDEAYQKNTAPMHSWVAHGSEH